MNLSNSLYLRGKYGVFGGDVQKIGEDLQILKPNGLPSPPRLFNRFYETVTSAILKLSKDAKEVFDKAIEEKLKNLKENRSYTMEKWDNTDLFKR